MITRIKRLRELNQVMGARWLWFRGIYWLKMRSGLIRLQVPAYPWKRYSLADCVKAGIPSEIQSYSLWRKQNLPPFFFQPDPKLPRDRGFDWVQIEDKARQLLKGNLHYFSDEYHQIGFPPDWLRDPISGFMYDNHLHWSRIPDYGAADIKFVWEASRFSFVYSLVRAYAIDHNEDFVQAYWKIISDWMDNNPPGFGPNWKDGQEVALRLLAACFGYFAFIQSPKTTGEQIGRFTLFVAAHARRIQQNLEFAIATHSNHTISEGFGLWLTGSLFPELKESAKFEQIGRAILEQEAGAQFFADGQYSMYSINYQRFAMQLYILAIQLAEIQNKPFSTNLKSMIERAVDFIISITEPTTGRVPQFGSNDGALVLQFNQTSFEDYRSLIQSGYYLFHKHRYFPEGAWDEDLFWVFGENALQSTRQEIYEPAKDTFPDGGLYVFRGQNSMAFFRCTHYLSRPSHADQFHFDLWWRQKNVLIDAGTFLYNGGGIWNNGLAHTGVHNTVTVDKKDQMTQASRITWVDWADGRFLGTFNRDGLQGLRFELSAFHMLDDPPLYQRSVIPIPGDRWLILDRLTAGELHNYRLHWLIADYPYRQIQSRNGLYLDCAMHDLQILCGASTDQVQFSLVRADPNSTRGWHSQLYARKEAALSMVLEANCSSINFWTYIGPGEDHVSVEGVVLNVESASQSFTINVDE